MNRSDIRIVHNESASRFEAHVEGALCVADYSMREPHTVVFNHTAVPPALQGRGIAGALVKEALAWCTREGHKVVPACSYVRGYMQRHPETQSMLAS